MIDVDNWQAGLLARFPALDPETVADSGQDSAVLVDHLAEAHDLTRAEAEEVLADWELRESAPALAA
ncbi:MAG: hypothetical protein AAF871_08995 [Pseudomonadota bacterium]